MTAVPIREVHRISTRLAFVLLLLFTGMAVLHTWPLAERPATWSRHDNGDAMLNEWVIAWLAHQLPRDPLHLFEANIFYPEPNTLAFSEHMFVQGLMGAPLLWAGLATLLVHNLLIMAGLALTGWTMGLVMYRWTGDYWAATVAGLLLAFNAHSLTSLAHLQAMHVEFLPLAVYALDRLFARPRIMTAVGLGVAIALQALTSNYLLVSMAFAMAAAAALRPAEWLGAGRGRAFLLLLLAAALASVVLIPFLLPYLHAQQAQGLTRPLDARWLYEGSWRAYLATGSRLHFSAWSAPFWSNSGAALFPGFTPLLLTSVAAASGIAWRDRTLRLWVAIGVAGFLLSFGTGLPGYGLLYRFVPLLQGIRAPVRFGYLTLVAIAALAGFGLAWLNQLEWLSRGRRRRALGLMTVVVITAEAARLPLGYVPRYEVPQVYHALTLERPGAVVELPLPPPPAFARNAPFMLNSMIGWWPLVNGYSGFLPESYRERRVDVALFPADESISLLRRLGVRYVVIHREEFSQRWPDALQRLDAASALRPVAAAGDIAIYRVEDAR